MQSFGRGWNLALTTVNPPTFKVSSTFSKVVESKGKAFGRPAHRAKLLSCKKSAGGETKQSGGLFCRGEPSPGVPRRVPTRGEFTQTVHTRRKFLCPVSSSMQSFGRGWNLAPTKILFVLYTVGTALAPVRQKIPRCKAKFLHISTQKRPGLKPERFFLYCNS